MLVQQYANANFNNDLHTRTLHILAIMRGISP